eukprot:gene5068-5309_t
MASLITLTVRGCAAVDKPNLCGSWELGGRQGGSHCVDYVWVPCAYSADPPPWGEQVDLETGAAAFEVTTAFAGFLGPVAVTAHAGVFSLTSLNYLALPFALATAATIRVGNLVGAGDGHTAAVSSKVVVVLGSSFMAVCGLAIFMARNKLGQLFTAGDAQVLRAVAVIAPLGALYQVGDGVLGTSQGVLRGLGRQAQLMVLNIVCFWCLGVPTEGWQVLQLSSLRLNEAFSKAKVVNIPQQPAAAADVGMMAPADAVERYLMSLERSAGTTNIPTAAAAEVAADLQAVPPQDAWEEEAHEAYTRLMQQQ